MTICHKPTTIISDQFNQRELTASYDVEMGLVRPKVKMIYLSGQRLFSFDTKDIFCYYR